MNLKIDKREFVAIVGPSGSGKSTLMHPIGLLDTLGSGNIDTKADDIVSELFRWLNREYNQTFLVVTHNENLASKADRIIRLVDGKIKDQ